MNFERINNKQTIIFAHPLQNLKKLDDRAHNNLFIYYIPSFLPLGVTLGGLLVPRTWTKCKKNPPASMIVKDKIEVVSSQCTFEAGIDSRPLSA